LTLTRDVIDPDAGPYGLAVQQLADQLVAKLVSIGSCVIAFSGGVDSAVVAAAAVRAHRLRSQADDPVERQPIAVTALSPAVPTSQREIASRVAVELGIAHRTVETDEGTHAAYIRNDTRRCFHCKQALYGSLQKIAEWASAAALPGVGSPRIPAAVKIVSGTNADDLGDHRPGIEAGRLAAVQTPLADLGIGKRDVRAIAALWGLSVAELPAAPCLASRIAYGVEVTPERLKRIERAESWLGEHGFSPLRVRLHPDELARIEVVEEEIARLVAQPLIGRLRSHFRDLGFRAITVDLEGFRSGSLNRLVALTLPTAEVSSG